MANNLSVLAPTLFSVAQEVSNEPFGVVSSINANFSDRGVAIGDRVTVPVAPTRSADTYSPAMTASAGANATAEAVQVEITANRMVSWNLTGEQIRSLENGGNFDEWVRQLIAQGMRTLRNEAERDAALAIKVGASRAVGTAGTNPFATNLNPLVDVRKILQDNGAPLADLQLCIDSSAGAAARKLGIIQQADQAGTAEERRQGVLLRQFGFTIRESAGILAHTPGTASSRVTSGEVAAGGRDFVFSGGSGTLVAGDIIGFNADTANRYVVGTGSGAGTSFSINRPGTRITIPTANAITPFASYVPNLAFERNAVVGVMRPPLIPNSPLIQQLPISDGQGMTYLLAQVVGDGMITWRLHLAWGFKAVQPEHIAILAG